MKFRPAVGMTLSLSLLVIAFCSCQSGPEIIPTSIPEGLNRIEIVMEGDQQEFGPVEETVYVIPKEMEVFNHQAVYNRGIRWIEVEEGNQHFVVADGVLFTKDMKKLIYCPIGRETVHYEIPSSVEEIGDFAFQYCRELEEITIPNSVKVIGDDAFWGCLSLKKITLPTGMTEISRGTFTACMELEEVVIPEGVISIGEYAFSGCGKLKSITLPSTLKRIDNFAFRGCESLTAISYPTKLEAIGTSAFRDCYRLESYPSTKLTVGADAFTNTRYESNQKEEFVINDSGVLTEYNGTKKVVVLPDEVVEIQGPIFTKSEITSLTLPAGFIVSTSEALGWDLTMYNTNLPSLNHQNLLLNSGDTFDEIIVHPDNPYYTVIDGVLYSKDLTALILYPQGKPDKEFRIPDHVKTISNSAFNHCNNLESVYIPDSVKMMGVGAFSRCRSLREVRMPEELFYEPGDFLDTPFFELSGMKIVQ